MTDIPEEGAVAINFNLKAPGYLIICPDHKQGIPKGVSVYLTHAFHEWVLKDEEKGTFYFFGCKEGGRGVACSHATNSTSLGGWNLLSRDQPWQRTRHGVSQG